MICGGSCYIQGSCLFFNTGITLASLSEYGNIPFSKDKLIILSRGILIGLENCFSSLVGMLQGPRVLPRLSVLITSSISLGDVDARMRVLSIGVVK